MLDTNIILEADSYKAPHWLTFPPNTTKIFYYIESRGGKWKETETLGIMELTKKLARKVTQEMIEEAEVVLTMHGEPFNREGWEYIVNHHDGKLPLRVLAVPEGCIVPVKNALAVVYNTDPEAVWLGGYIEDIVMQSIWYPTTVGTLSREIKKNIKKFLIETADDEALLGLDFMLHDFGVRGVSSMESSRIGGASHLVNFKGTDNLPALVHIMKNYYDYKNKVAAFSVPAGEHSSIITWGRSREVDAYRNMLQKFSKYKIISIVADSYDVINAVKLFGTVLKDEVIAHEASQSGARVVIRPDSGDPAMTVLSVIRAIDDYFGHHVNKKGYKVLNHMRVLQGDGIEELSINHIMAVVKSAGYSIENLACFGMGGKLLQGVDRDTLKFAYKACAAIIDGKLVGVSKDPITDPGKKSKEGIPVLISDEYDKPVTKLVFSEIEFESLLQSKSWFEEVFINGYAYNNSTFDKIRERAAI